MPYPFSAELEAGEIVLQFPYHDGIRRLLRAIPGRRWDPAGRVWRLPLDPERAEATARLLAGLPGRPQISEELARRIARMRRLRDPEACVLDLARPDESWWLSFPTDRAPAVVHALSAHPSSCLLPTIGRGLAPLDEDSARVIAALLRERQPLRLTEDATHALTELSRRRAGGVRDPAPRAAPRSPGSWSPRWRGSIEVGYGPVEPLVMLLGDVDKLPEGLRARGETVPGGVGLPLTRDCCDLVYEQLCVRHRAWLSDAARRCIDAVREGRPAPPSVLEVSTAHAETAFVLAPGHDERQLVAFASLPGALRPVGGGRDIEEHRRLPGLQADPFCVPSLDAFIAEHEVWVEPEALTLLQEIREQHAEGAGLVALSSATDAELSISGLGGELKPFQRAGVRYLLSQRRAFLADEQGLGKTIEALAAIELDRAYPAIVLCPASLKLNWKREIERWLPRRRVCVLSGVSERPIEPADIVVANYDIVAARLQALSALAPKALVLDESHYCKNAAAARTKATHQLAGAVARDGLLLALTGTPVVNRPAELISQLRILRRLADFGSGAQFGSRFKGANAHMRLHWHLRARCFVRRLKSDVLPQLPPKTRAIVPMQLDNAGEYKLAEHDLVAWLRTQPLELRELDAKIAAALRAERLVRLNALKLLAAEGKLRCACAWIHDFLSSGERLVVFARHRRIQQALIERFPGALHILGTDSHAARDAAASAFQGPDLPANQLLVCSIEVAGEGITLTRASNVAFLELDWTPARHDQAEDRCHRIGQHDAVNVTYLLAADTIDEQIAALLERKRSVIGAVTDGHERDEESVIDALARELRSAPFRHLRAVA